MPLWYMKDPKSKDAGDTWAGMEFYLLSVQQRKPPLNVLVCNGIRQLCNGDNKDQQHKGKPDIHYILGKLFIILLLYYIYFAVCKLLFHFSNTHQRRCNWVFQDNFLLVADLGTVWGTLIPNNILVRTYHPDIPRIVRWVHTFFSDKRKNC